MLGFGFIALLPLQAPKSFQDLELAKVVAFHNLTALHLEMETDVSTTQVPTTTRTSLFRDGKRSHAILTVPGGQKMEWIDDGTKTWLILHENKKYWESNDADSPPFSAEKSLLVAEKRHFSVNLTGIGPIQFASDPPLQIQSFSTVDEFGSQLRKIVAGAISPSGHHLTITQWFLPDRWLVKRAEVNAESDSGIVKTEAKVIIMDLHPAFKEGEFNLDPRTVLGYEKQAGPPPGLGT